MRDDRIRAASRRCLVSAAVAAVAAVTVGAALAQPAPSAALDDLAARVASQGPMRVVVTLDLPLQAESALGAAGVQKQRRAIAVTRASVVAQALAGTQSRVGRQYETVPAFSAEIDANALARLRASPQVRAIEADIAVPPTLLQSTQLVNAPSAWGSGLTGTGWTVAVLDTGVDKTHPFLSGKVVSEACYSSNTAQSTSVCPGGASSSTAVGSAVPCVGSGDCAHGTHVAGIASGGPRSTTGMRGVAPTSNVIAIQVFSLFPNHNGSGATRALTWTSDWIAGLDRVNTLRTTYNIASANMSLGGGQYAATCDGVSPSATGIIATLRANGIATVISTGNNGFTTSMAFPACISSAISVGATCDNAVSGFCAAGTNGVASYSNTTNWVSLLAPGSLIESSVPGTGYAHYNGTSMAAPHVAGAWALVKQAHPGWSVDQTLGWLRTNGLTIDDTRSGGAITGMKRIDLANLGSSTFELTVTRAGTAASSGTVTSAPAGITCGADCTENYASGTVVTLTAAAGSGATFAGWSGACTGTAATCTVTMSAARSVTATFNTAAVMRLLTMNKTGALAANGTVTSSPAGIACGADCTQEYVNGTVVTLTASAPSGTLFGGWGGACTSAGTSPTCTVTMSTARTVSAKFVPTTYNLTVRKLGTFASTGLVTSSPAGINCGATCVRAFPTFSTVTLTATAPAGRTFGGWGGSCLSAGTSTTCTVTMNAARNATATFN